MSRIIGIDLGTSNSAASVMEGGRPTMIPSAEGTSVGGKSFPSYVAFTKDGQLLVGEPARRQAVTNPDGTIKNVKRKMGSNEKVTALGKEYTPQQISAFILQKIKKDAEAYIGETVDKAVITVPAYFNDNQRQATKDAGAIAGLDVVRIINEPTAAALAYGLDKGNADETIAVYDLGGGTFDISILEIGDGVFEVKATNGNTHLGGDDFDTQVVNWLAETFKAENGVDLRNDPQALQRLKEAAEKAKCELSSSMSSEINLPFITMNQNGPLHLQITLTRAKLEELCDDLLQSTVGPCENCVRDSGVSKDKINEVILVGGMTRMPKAQEMAKTIFGREPHKGVNPDEVVAAGAAIQGGVLGGEVNDVVLLDVTPLSLGIETLGGVTTKLIDRNTTIPTKKSEVFSTAADNQPSVDIHVLQGERNMAADNKSIGRFRLDGIAPAPRGVPQIEVTFDIDANGILSVTAKDLGTGKEQKITITASSGLSEEEIQKMVNDAKAHENEDKAAKEKIEVKNKADSMVYQTEKQLKDLGDKLSPEAKSSVQESIDKLKADIKNDNTEAMKATMKELEERLMKFGEEIYKSQAANQAGAQGAPNAGAADAGAKKNDDGVVDAEIVDDDK